MNPNVYLSISGTLARSLFTLIYTVVFFILGFFAKACYEVNIQLSLLRGQNMSLVKAIGWRRGIEVLTAWRKTGLFPMGWWYPVMLFIVLASYTTHYLTNTIEGGTKYHRCNFTQGLVLDRYPIMDNPSPSTLSLDYTTDAQMVANRSSPKCAVGVYEKIPNDFDTQPYQFCPQTSELTGWDESDVLGAWTCNKTGSIVYPANMSPKAVTIHGQTEEFLYDNNNNYFFSWHSPVNKTGVQYNQIVVWSASIAQNVSSELWAIKFGIQVNESWSDPFEFDYYSCGLDPYSDLGANILDQIQRAINVSAMIITWSPSLPRALFFGYDSNARTDAGLQMAMLLNSIMMISGSSDFLYGTAYSDRDPTNGCLFSGSEVPIYVIVYMALSMALCVFFITWYSVLRLQLHCLTYEKAYVQLVPSDIATWAAMAAYLSPRARRHDIASAETIPKTSMTETSWTRQKLQDQHIRMGHDGLVIYKDDELLEPQEPQDSYYNQDTAYAAVPNKDQLEERARS